MVELLPDGVRVVRTIRARRADVFDAWVDPERLRAWWGPPGVTVTGLDGELRVGGQYRIAMRMPDGGARELVWTFREIAPPERLVYGWRYGGEESTVTVLFRDAGDRTEVEIVHTELDDPQTRAGHGDGWVGCLDGLETTLNQMV